MSSKRVPERKNMLDTVLFQIAWLTRAINDAKEAEDGFRNLLDHLNELRSLIRILSISNDMSREERVYAEGFLRRAAKTSRLPCVKQALLQLAGRFIP